MTELRAQGYGMGAICELAGITRQAYHQRLSREAEESENLDQAEAIVIINRQARSRAGLRVIFHKEQLWKIIGLNKYEREMSARGYALKRTKNFMKTTDSRGHYNKFENITIGMIIQSENELIVGDITYYRNGEELYYIFTFRDFYTLEIKGIVGSKTMEGKNAEKCLRQVFSYNKRSKYNYKMILLTDGGSQYRSNPFIGMLRKAEIIPSHAQNCFENGLAEQTNGLLKNEYLVDYDIKSVSQLNKVLKQIQYQVNEVWPSKRLGYQTPKAFAEKMRNTNKSQRPVKIVKEV